MTKLHDNRNWYQPQAIYTSLYKNLINRTTETVWATYKDELQAVIDWTTAENIELVTLDWPNLRDIAASKSLTEPVIHYFRSRGVSRLSIWGVLADESAASLTVNLFDAHPSIYSHESAAPP